MDLLREEAIGHGLEPVAAAGRLEIEERVGHLLDVIVDAGPTGIEPTTVLDLTGGDVQVLRVGRGDVRGLV